MDTMGAVRSTGREGAPTTVTGGADCSRT